MIKHALECSVRVEYCAVRPRRQTLNMMMKSIDAPHYDAQRTTWGPTSDIVNMFQDTLVALDWDGRTPIPISPSPGRSAPTARPTPSSCATTSPFCSGKKFTADDVIYSFKRLKSPEIKGPFASARRNDQGAARA